MQNKKLYAASIALIVSIGGFLLGFGGAVISGAVPFYKVSFNLPDSPWLIGFSVGSIILGSILGNMIAGKTGDRLGRKKGLLLTAVLFMVTTLLAAFANNITLFILARILGGVAVGLAILIAPMYIAEIAPSKQRGVLVTFNQLNIILGISIAYFSNYFILKLIENPEMNWRWMIGVGFIPAAAYFFLLFIIPESPRWLISNGREGEGHDVLKKFNSEEEAEREFVQIKRNINAEANSEKASFKELFTKKMSTVLMIGLALAFFQQISGINAVFYYAPLIFEMAGGGKDAAFMQAIILGVVNVGVTILSMFLIDRLGRKPLLLAGSAIMAVSLFLAGWAFQQAEYKVTPQSVENVKEVVFKNAIVAEATKQDPANYKYDKLDIQADKALMYKAGVVTATVDFNSPAMKQGKLETEALGVILKKFEGISYNSEVEFFSLFRLYLEQNKEAFPTAAVVGAKYSEYKPLLLNNSIQINASIVLAGILGFIAGFSISLGPVMWAMLSEIFPNKLRGLAISVAGTWNAITSFVVATVFPVELEYLGSSMTYYIYAGFMVLSFFFVMAKVKETKGKSLEEIEAELIVA